MNLDIITALIAFAFVGSITPGPNNLMLMASGTNFGMKRTLPHILGINTGFIVMIFLVGFGLMQVFEMFPATFNILKIISVAYLLYLAWKIATTNTVNNTNTTRANPMSFLQAAFFQWVNPKAWIMILSTITTYTQSSPSLSTLCIITGYRAVINRKAFGGSLLLFVTVGLSRHQRADQDLFEKTVALAPEVRECHTVTGTFEYILRIEVADVEAYKNFHEAVLGKIPQVGSITTYIAIDTTKDERG